MKIVLVLISIAFINSCTTLTVATTQNVGVDHKVSVTTTPTVGYVQSKTERVVVCDDRSVLLLASYALPEKPNVDLLGEGDVVAELTLLLDHIELLRRELKIVAKDYGCVIK